MTAGRVDATSVADDQLVRAPAAPGSASSRRRAAGRLVLAALSGLLAFAAFPPMGWGLAAPFAVAGLTLAVRQTGRRAAFGLGVVFGLAFFVPLLVWIRTIGTDAWLLLALVMALELGLTAVGVRAVERLPGGPLWTAALWVLSETLRSRWPLGGFPWGRWAYAESATPLVHLAAWGGAPLVSFAVALTGAVLAQAVVSAGRARPVAVGCLAGLCALVALPVLIALPTAGQSAGGAPTLTAALVQGNVPRLGLDLSEQRDRVTLNHVQATQQLAAVVAAGTEPRPQVVIWPENATDIDPRLDPRVHAEVTDAVAAAGVPVLVGAVLNGSDSSHVLNAGVVWDPATGPGEMYVKRHLVPFGEYIPFRAEIGSLIGQFRAIPYDFQPGSGSGLLQLGPAKVGDVICYEVAYDGLVRSSVEAGARVLVVQTNNATYGRTETSQQLAMARLRAVEHGRSVLVAATSGISAVIAPDGRVVDSSKVFTQKVLVDRVPLRDSLTLADRLKAAPEWGLASLGVLGLLLAAAHGRRPRRRSR